MSWMEKGGICGGGVRKKKRRPPLTYKGEASYKKEGDVSAKRDVRKPRAAFEGGQTGEKTFRLSEKARTEKNPPVKNYF